jgi:hypothetical protein
VKLLPVRGLVGIDCAGIGGSENCIPTNSGGTSHIYLNISMEE